MQNTNRSFLINTLIADFRENRTFNEFHNSLIHLYTCDDTHQKYPDSGEGLLSPAVPGQRQARR